MGSSSSSSSSILLPLGSVSKSDSSNILHVSLYMEGWQTTTLVLHKTSYVQSHLSPCCPCLRYLCGIPFKEEHLLHTKPTYQSSTK